MTFWHSLEAKKKPEFFHARGNGGEWFEKGVGLTQGAVRVEGIEGTEDVSLDIARCRRDPISALDQSGQLEDYLVGFALGGMAQEVKKVRPPGSVMRGSRANVSAKKASSPQSPIRLRTPIPNDPSQVREARNRKAASRASGIPSMAAS